MIFHPFPFVRFKIHGESMAPYFPHGKTILVHRLSYLFGNPRGGDVVIVRDPRERSRELIKRITAIPGDRVKDRTLQENEYFVRGDNSSQSTDSCHFGPILRESIIGKVSTSERIH